MIMTPDLLEAVANTLRGRKEAFNKIIDRFQNPVAAFIWNFFHDRNLLPDLTQEVFLRSFQSLNTLKDATRFRSWLFQIAYHVCLQFADKRRMEREKLLQAGIYQERLMGIEPDRVTDENIHALLEKLSPLDCLLVWLRYVEEIPYREIAELVELSEVALRQRVSRAIQFLREVVR